MSREEKNTIAAVAGVLAVLVVVVGLTLGWPAWVWIPLAVLPAAAGVVLGKRIASSRRPEPFPEPIVEPDQPPPPEPNQVELPEVSLPSAVPDYFFLVSGTVYWRRNSKSPGREHWNLDSVAKEAITSRAGAALLTAQPHEHSVLAERLNVELGTEQLVPSGHVYAWGGAFVVTLPEADRNRLQRLADVRKNIEVWEQERSHERNVREYLGDDVLSSPGSAVVWWLARHYQDEGSGISTAVDNIGRLRDLTAAAHETQHPSRDANGDAANGDASVQDRIHPLVTWIDETFADRDADERDLFVRWQAGRLATFQKHEEAAALRAHYSIEELVPGAVSNVAGSESGSVESPGTDGQADQGPSRVR